MPGPDLRGWQDLPEKAAKGAKKGGEAQRNYARKNPGATEAHLTKAAKVVQRAGPEGYVLGKTVEYGAKGYGRYEAKQLAKG